MPFPTCALREETELIEGEVVEIQIDRPAMGTVGGCSSAHCHELLLLLMLLLYVCV